MCTERLRIILSSIIIVQPLYGWHTFVEIEITRVHMELLRVNSPRENDGNSRNIFIVEE